jgi:hypothetical protein
MDVTHENLLTGAAMAAKHSSQLLKSYLQSHSGKSQTKAKVDFDASQ